MHISTFGEVRDKFIIDDSTLRTISTNHFRKILGLDSFSFESTLRTIVTIELLIKQPKYTFK